MTTKTTNSRQVRGADSRFQPPDVQIPTSRGPHSNLQGPASILQGSRFQPAGKGVFFITSCAQKFASILRPIGAPKKQPSLHFGAPGGQTCNHSLLFEVSGCHECNPSKHFALNWGSEKATLLAFGGPGASKCNHSLLFGVPGCPECNPFLQIGASGPHKWHPSLNCRAIKHATPIACFRPGASKMEPLHEFWVPGASKIPPLLAFWGHGASQMQPL